MNSFEPNVDSVDIRSRGQAVYYTKISLSVSSYSSVTLYVKWLPHQSLQRKEYLQLKKCTESMPNYLLKDAVAAWDRAHQLQIPFSHAGATYNMDGQIRFFFIHAIYRCQYDVINPEYHHFIAILLHFA